MDIEALLQPVSGDMPCGEDLEYDSEFQKLELASEPTPEKRMGDEVIPGEEPDWKAVKKVSLNLCARTHDVRVAVLLSQSLLANDGLQGFADGIHFINGLLEQYWDCVYPQQDPGDEYPISRMNTLMGLANPEVTLKLLRHYPLISVKGIGQFNFLDIEIAEGKRKPAKDQTDPPNEAMINAAFKDLSQEKNTEPLQQVESNIQQLARLQDLLNQLVRSLNDKVSAAYTPDFSALIDTIHQLQGMYKKYHTPMNTDDVSTGETQTEPTASAGGVIRSRDQALQTIDLVCDYFTHYEPSSPVPFMLKRAKRLVNMDFIQILEDMVPDSVSQAETIISGHNRDG